MTKKKGPIEVVDSTLSEVGPSMMVSQEFRDSL